MLNFLQICRGWQILSAVTGITEAAFMLDNSSIGANGAQSLSYEGGTVKLPSDGLWSQVEFSRAGADLVLTTHSGHVLVAEGYFTHSSPPDVVAPNGDKIAGETVKLLAGPLAPAEYAQASGDMGGADSIGTVQTLEGHGSVKHTNGIVVDLRLGTPVFQGDVVTADQGAKVGIVFADKSVFALSDGGTMVLNQLVYNPAGNSNSMFFNIIKGTAGFITGNIVKTGTMDLATPVAVMAIRGTSGVAGCSSADGCFFEALVHNFDLLRDGKVIANVAKQVVKIADSHSSAVPYHPTAEEQTQINGVDHLLTTTFQQMAQNFFGDTGTADFSALFGSGFSSSNIGILINALDTITALLNPTEQVNSEATAEQLTITGTNDAATVSSDSKSVTEGDTAAALDTSGQLTITDPDTGQAHVVAQSNVAGTYGTFSIDANGAWTYTGNGPHNELTAGQQVQDQFTVYSQDGTASGTVTVTITGTNDAATVSSDSKSVTEGDTAAALDTSGQLTITDPDTGQAHVVAQSNVAGTYGTFSIDANGAWTYTGNGPHNELTAGQQVQDQFTVYSQDGTASGTVTVTITGTNDAATVSSDSKSVTEGDTAAALDTSGQLTITDPDTGQAHVVAQSNVAGTYGTFSIDANGAWTYTGNGPHNELTAGQQVQDQFTVYSQDGTASGTVTVTITGTNDAATVSSDSKSVTEGDTAAALDTSGQLTITDPDTGQAHVVAQSNVAGTYGTFSIDANGAWTYTGNGPHNELTAGQQVQDQFTVYSQDGTASGTVTVTITGTNDAATVSSDSKSVTEGDTAAALDTSGQLTITDPDTGQAHVVAQSNVAGTYGTFSIDANGAWTYTGNGPHNELTAGQQVQDQFTVYSQDGTASGTVTVTITGTNDAATVSSDSKSVTEGDTAAALDTSGQLTITDPDTGQAHVVAQSNVAGTYGTFSIDANGAWTYTGNGPHNELTAGQQVQDQFTVYSQDGTVSGTVTVTITGTNDAATVSSDSKSVTEGDTAAALDTSGQLTITDPDTGQAHVVAQSNVAGTYGTFSIDANGAWTYTGNGPHNELTAGQQVQDQFTVYSQDGTASGTVTVTITGTNDAATVSSDSKSVTEGDTAAALDTSGQLTITDPDTGQAHVVAQSNVAGTYGTFSIDANGAWTYTGNGPHNELTAGQQVQDQFTVYSQDGTASGTVTVTITGTNDAATVSSDSKSVTEGDTAAALDTSGQLTITDPDTGQAHVVAQSNVAGTYGTFSIDANGAWTYTGNGPHNELTAGQQVQDQFTVYSQDGTVSGTVTVTITGTNDAATVSDIQLNVDAPPSQANNFNFNFSANLSVSASDAGPFTYTFADGSTSFTASDGTVFTISPGDLLASASFLSPAQDYILDLKVFDSASGTAFSETIHIITDATNNVSANVLQGTSGDDVLYGANENDVINGFAGNDSLFGQADNDSLQGGTGNDLLVGGGGADTMTGGDGNDTFAISGGESAANVSGQNDSGTVSGYDVITDFNPTADKLQLDGTPFAAANVGAVDGTDLHVTIAGQTIKSHSITNGIITFDDANTFSSLLSLTTSSDVAAVVDYLQRNDLGNAGTTVAFTATIGGVQHTFVYEQIGATPSAQNDILVDLQGSNITDLSQLFNSGAVDPIILDLGTPGIDLSQTVSFDLNADGQAETIAWPGGQDGLLVMDTNHSGTIENGTEVISPYFGQGGYANALAALASLDSNGDGVINSADPAYANLLVWQDQNHNGVSDQGELKTLATLGISSISLTASTASSSIDGQSVLAQGTFTYTSGGSGDYIMVGLDQTSGSTTGKLDYSRETGPRGVVVNLSNSAVQADIGYGAALVTAMAMLDSFGNAQALPAGVNEVIGTDHTDAIFAGATAATFDAGGGNDILHGSAGADVLIGGAGDDHISGNGGADTIVGGSGVDTADYSANTTGVSINLDDSGNASGTPADLTSPADGQIAGGFAEGNQLSGIENIIGSSHDDVLIGNAMANLLDGKAGNDLLNGEGGNDVLLGGPGDDTLIGGEGKDVLVGGQGADTFVIDHAALNDAIQHGVVDLIADYQQNTDVIDLTSILNVGFDPTAISNPAVLEAMTQDYVRYISSNENDTGQQVPGGGRAGQLWVNTSGDGHANHFVMVADVQAFDGGGASAVNVLVKIDDGQGHEAAVLIT